MDSLLGNEFGPVDAAHEKLGSIALVDDPSPNDGDLDILGALGSSLDQAHTHRFYPPPSETTHRSSPPQTDPTTSNQYNSRHPQSLNRPDSPPPHILGQVVEIGFPPSLSYQALAQTWDPKTASWDVQSVIEVLLSTSQAQQTADDDTFTMDAISKPGSTFKPAGRGTGRQTRLMDQNRQSKPENIGALPNTKEIQDQAAELLAQASAYGSTALGKAASFWKQSKASLSRVIKDQTGSSSSSNDTDPPKPTLMLSFSALNSSTVSPSLFHFLTSTLFSNQTNPTCLSPSAPKPLVYLPYSHSLAPR